MNMRQRFIHVLRKHDDSGEGKMDPVVRRFWTSVAELDVPTERAGGLGEACTVIDLVRWRRQPIARR